MRSLVLATSISQATVKLELTENCSAMAQQIQAPSAPLIIIRYDKKVTISTSSSSNVNIPLKCLIARLTEPVRRMLACMGHPRPAWLTCSMSTHQRDLIVTYMTSKSSQLARVSALLWGLEMAQWSRALIASITQPCLTSASVWQLWTHKIQPIRLTMETEAIFLRSTRLTFRRI